MSQSTQELLTEDPNYKLIWTNFRPKIRTIPLARCGCSHVTVENIESLLTSTSVCTDAKSTLKECEASLYWERNERSTKITSRDAYHGLASSWQPAQGRLQLH
jgi:hypothetical protein